MPKMSAPSSAPASASDAEIRRLRLSKIELTKQYNSKTLTVKKLAVTARNERNPAMKVLLFPYFFTSLFHCPLPLSSFVHSFFLSVILTFLCFVISF